LVDGSCGFGGDFAAAQDGNFNRAGFRCGVRDKRFPGNQAVLMSYFRQENDIRQVVTRLKSVPPRHRSWADGCGIRKNLHTGRGGSPLPQRFNKFLLSRAGKT
jgi:hypothetical protein